MSVIFRLRRERGGDLSVAQRGASMGDNLIIDFEVFEQESGNPIEGMGRERHELDCISENNFLPGVMPRMMGMQVGEIKNFDFVFPDPWEPEQYAGLAAMVRYLHPVCDELCFHVCYMQWHILMWRAGQALLLCLGLNSVVAVVQVKVKLREVLEWNLPELTLEMCKSVKEDVESIDQFQNDLREAVRLEAAEELQVSLVHSRSRSLQCLTDPPVARAI